MPELTPSFVFEYERRMRAISEQEYARRLSSEFTWWNKVCRTMNIQGKTERITWLLSTAMIEPTGPTNSGILTFEELVTQTVEYPTFRHGKGIRVQRDQIEDLNGTGLEELTEWSAQIGNEIAYYPQRLAAQLLLNGANTDGSANAYDTVPFFADNTARTIGGVSVKGHPYNPFRPSLGGYSNWLHGSSASGYPGALPIDDSVDVDTALKNLGKAIAHVQGWKMPNGVDPRFLTVKGILAPPRMAPRLRQLTNAAFIAQAVGSAGGSADVQAVIQGWGLGQPMIAMELGGTITYTANMPFMVTGGSEPTFLSETMTGNDTTYYLILGPANESQLGSLLHLVRKPFKVTYYTGDQGGTGVDAILDRANELEYHVQGRMANQYGHPYGLLRVDGS